MSCTAPNDGYKVADVITGEIQAKLVFKLGLPGKVLVKAYKVPCGQCASCRIRRSREWGVRCMHESKMYEKNCFITLTFSDENLPNDGNINIVHMQGFLKRLRSRNPGVLIRDFYCGEYGEKLSRPHYHCLLFNYDFPDKTHWKDVNGKPYFRSTLLEELWPYGFCLLSDVTYESACYVAGYIQKKFTGRHAANYYKGRTPEFAHMSTGTGKPGSPTGIGSTWLTKWSKDVYPSDQVILNFHPVLPPRYYDKQLEKNDPALLEKLKVERVIRAEKYAGEQTFARRKARNFCLKDKIKKQKRSFENGTE